jgi:hypothetical protein
VFACPGGGVGDSDTCSAQISGAPPFSRSLREGEFLEASRFQCHSEDAQAVAKRMACQRRISALLPGTSASHYTTGEEGATEIESRWTARRREQLGVYPPVRRSEVS